MYCKHAKRRKRKQKKKARRRTKIATNGCALIEGLNDCESKQRCRAKMQEFLLEAALIKRTCVPFIFVILIET